MQKIREMMAKCKNRKGFTLVELLVVLAVIAILFVVYISRVDFATDRTKEVGVKTDFRSYQLAAETVAREHTGFAFVADASADGTAGKLHARQKLANALNYNLDSGLVLVASNANDTTAITTAAKDPWGTAYVITQDLDKTGVLANVTSVTFTSLGADGVTGNDDYSLTVTYGADGVISSKTTGFSVDIEK